MSIIPMAVMKKVDDFWRRWVYMDTHQASSLFLIPAAPAVKHSGWEQAKLSGEELAPLVERMRLLRAGGLTG
ncbi:hypothetical protein JBE27_57955 [Streptomyces albiflaviniger]|nr:hypothetical protein [Streptomyces albiflaviniger]